jgi:hypothetical protein
MSCLREIRLIIAQNLDLPNPTRAAVIEVLTALDVSLDTEGYEPPSEVVEAIDKIYKSILESTDIYADEDTTEEEEEEEENEYIELDDIIYDEDDDGDEDEDDADL